MSRELKQCPFCGGEVKIDSVDNEFSIVFCEKCGSATSFGIVFEDGTAGDATKAETIEKWNRRIKE